MTPSALSAKPYPVAVGSEKCDLFDSLSTGIEVRNACRNGFSKVTSGLAPTYLQRNLIALPSRYAADFRNLCARNPVPCPLLAESEAPGNHTLLKSYIEGVEGNSMANSMDIRQNVPYYMVYENGKLVEDTVKDIMEEWTADHVAFLIGCSFSFETALTEAGLTSRHIIMNRNVAMYRTTVPLCKARVFDSRTNVVSMRPYKKNEIDTVRAITRPYLMTHGEPIAWGWNAVVELGIENIDEPDWDCASLLQDTRPLSEADGDEDNIPVFWACGATPQEAVMKASLEGTVMAHAPGYMLVLGLPESGHHQDLERWGSSKLKYRFNFQKIPSSLWPLQRVSNQILVKAHMEGYKDFIQVNVQYFILGAGSLN
jgi:uncharacterized protein YcsI (UPF0317 family)